MLIGGKRVIPTYGRKLYRNYQCGYLLIPKMPGEGVGTSAFWNAQYLFLRKLSEIENRDEHYTMCLLTLLVSNKPCHFLDHSHFKENTQVKERQLSLDGNLLYNLSNANDCRRKISLQRI